MSGAKKWIIVLLSMAVALPAVAQTKPSTAVFNAWCAAVNKHDVTALTALMANDLAYIDASGEVVKGQEQVVALWAGCFKSLPDYHMEITGIFQHGDTLAAFGWTQGSFMGVKESHWRLPASWQVIMSGKKIKTWQVYMDTKLPGDMQAKGALATKSASPAVPHVTGIGGVFFKSKNPAALRAWYKQYLHLDAGPYGANFDWRQGDDATKYGCTNWSLFGEKTTYFAPSEKDFMINYRVTDLEQLVPQLRKGGVTIIDSIETVEYGKFIHILDGEQNKVELWEPSDADYDKVVGGRAKQ